jgi:hypothetical protein
MSDNTTSNPAPTSTTEQRIEGGFVPDYSPIAGLRILRSRLRTSEGGTATVRFRGQIADATTDVWLERGTSGRLSLYAQVDVDDTTATEIKVAVVPTGKRVPAISGDTARAHRIGSVGGTHVYLLGVDGTVDRAAWEQEIADERAKREAARQARQILAASLVVGFDDDPDLGQTF